LGYEPDRAAQRLGSRKSDVLGLIVADIQNPHFVSVIQGVQDAAYRNGMNIILCDTDESPGRFSENVHVLQAESVAGLIVVPTPSGNADALRSIQKDNVPVVVLDRAVDGVAIDTVMVDNTAGAHAAVKHLINLGRRRIAGIFPDVQTGDERRDGYVQAHLDAGLGQPAKELILTGSYRSKGSYEVALSLFRNQDVDAVFTATNFVTLGVIRAIRELGIAVPQDIALVGFDDMPWADEPIKLDKPPSSCSLIASTTATERLVGSKCPSNLLFVCPAGHKGHPTRESTAWQPPLLMVTCQKATIKR